MFFSHALTKCERNYSTYERELLALVKAVNFFAVYLLYNTFVWRTDHAALRNLFRSDLKLSSRVSRWILALQPYKAQIELVRGKDNVLADALSRIQSEGLQFETVDVPSGPGCGSTASHSSPSFWIRDKASARTLSLPLTSSIWILNGCNAKIHRETLLESFKSERNRFRNAA